VPSAGAEAAEARAKELYQRGAAAFASGRFAEAAALCEEAYRLSHRTSLLYNIAQSYRRLFDVDHDLKTLRQAQAVYRNYLDLVESAAEKRQAQAALGEVTRTLEAAERQVASSAGAESEREARIAADLAAKKAAIEQKMAEDLAAAQVALQQRATAELEAARRQIEARASSEAVRVAREAADQSARRVLVEGAQASPEQLARRRRAGVGLGVTGGALLLGGVVLVSLSAAQAATLVDAPTLLARNEQIDQLVPMRIAGAAALGVGAVAATVGIVLSARASARTSAPGVGPRQPPRAETPARVEAPGAQGS
jgi:tetratricopeptide (TPR) repeat protein